MNALIHLASMRHSLLYTFIRPLVQAGAILVLWSLHFGEEGRHFKDSHTYDYKAIRALQGCPEGPT